MTATLHHRAALAASLLRSAPAVTPKRAQWAAYLYGLSCLDPAFVRGMAEADAPDDEGQQYELPYQREWSREDCQP